MIKLSREDEDDDIKDVKNKWTHPDCVAVFRKIQFKKCGYCESKTSTSAHIDHYRPKDKIENLVDPNKVVIEYDGTTKIKDGRNYEEVIGHGGYKWLRENWDNYILACPICNSSYKRCLFPVRNNLRLTGPTCTNVEEPLLINPFDENPETNFRYTVDGFMFGLTEKGKTTITVCGLSRQSLQEERLEVATELLEHIKNLKKAQTKNETVLILRQIKKMASPKSEFAGFVRALTQEHAGLSYKEIVDYLSVNSY